MHGLCFLEQMNYLRSVFQINPDVDVINTNSTLVIEAAKRGYTDSVAILVRHGASLDKTDNGGNTALHWAAQYNLFDVVEFLVHLDCPMNTLDKDRRSALAIATMAGHLKIVQLLYSYGASTVIRGAADPLQLAGCYVRC